jgi:hypothetical protein
VRKRFLQKAALGPVLASLGLAAPSFAQNQAGPPAVQPSQTAPPELPTQALPPIWTLDGGLTRISDADLNRFFTDFPVAANHYLPDTAWRYTAGLKFQPRFPEEVPLKFNYSFTRQNYENLNAFDFTANDLSMEASLPKFAGIFPHVGAGLDWSSDSQNLTGNARWGSFGFDLFGSWVTAMRFDATIEGTDFAESERNASQLDGRALFVKVFAPTVSVYIQYNYTRNDALDRDFSYNENVPETGVIWRQKEWLEWSLRGQAHFRDYFGVDSRFLVRRDDILNDVFLNARFILVENFVSAFSSMQWEKNLSNVSEKTYDDQIFSVGLQISY